jgi:hypothetical protein
MAIGKAQGRVACGREGEKAICPVVDSQDAFIKKGAHGAGVDKVKKTTKNWLKFGLSGVSWREMGPESLWLTTLHCSASRQGGISRVP